MFRYFVVDDYVGGRKGTKRYGKKVKVYLRITVSNRTEAGATWPTGNWSWDPNWIATAMQRDGGGRKLIVYGNGTGQLLWTEPISLLVPSNKIIGKVIEVLDSKPSKSRPGMSTTTSSLKDAADDILLASIAAQYAHGVAVDRTDLDFDMKETITMVDGEQEGDDCDAETGAIPDWKLKYIAALKVLRWSRAGLLHKKFVFLFRGKVAYGKSADLGHLDPNCNGSRFVSIFTSYRAKVLRVPMSDPTIRFVDATGNFNDAILAHNATAASSSG